MLVNQFTWKKFSILFNMPKSQFDNIIFLCLFFRTSFDFVAFHKWKRRLLQSIWLDEKYRADLWQSKRNEFSIWYFFFLFFSFATSRNDFLLWNLCQKVSFINKNSFYGCFFLPHPKQVSKQEVPDEKYAHT